MNAALASAVDFKNLRREIMRFMSVIFSFGGMSLRGDFVPVTPLANVYVIVYTSGTFESSIAPQGEVERMNRLPDGFLC